MLIMLICGLLLLLGLGAGVRWGGRPFVTPPPIAEPTPADVARRFVWYSSILLLAGIPAGLSVIGAGGRLAMRLLAVTAGDDAQGRITEASEVVGKITADGTVGFVIFNGIFGGVIATALYLAVRRILPAGRLGGLTFGLGLLLVLGATIDPLRRNNPDFDIVGPGWLAVVVFTVLAIAFGPTLQGITARMSTWLPQLSGERAVLVRYAAPAAIAVVAFTVTAILAIICLVVVLITRSAGVVRAARSSRAVLGARVAAIGAVAVSLPNALSSIAHIASR